MKPLAGRQNAMELDGIKMVRDELATLAPSTDEQVQLLRDQADRDLKLAEERLERLIEEASS